MTGEFIIYWLLTNGYEWIQDKKDATDNTFTTLISDMGQFYNITVFFKVENKKKQYAEFFDSLKIIPFGVDETAKSFNLPISKLKLDYAAPRELGHILTEHEKDYITNDVLIMSKALKVLFDEDLTKMTRAGNALKDYKKIITERRFKHLFPELSKEIDSDIRQSYKRWLYLCKP